MALTEELFNCVVNGDAEAVRLLTSQAIAQGFAADELLNQALIPAMTQVGPRFERHEFYVPEMLIATRW